MWPFFPTAPSRLPAKLVHRGNLQVPENFERVSNFLIIDQSIIKRWEHAQIPQHEVIKRPVFGNNPFSLSQSTCWSCISNHTVIINWKCFFSVIYYLLAVMRSLHSFICNLIITPYFHCFCSPHRPCRPTLGGWANLWVFLFPLLADWCWSLINPQLWKR